jgi:hypothetical protein
MCCSGSRHSGRKQTLGLNAIQEGSDLLEVCSRRSLRVRRECGLTFARDHARDKHTFRPAGAHPSPPKVRRSITIPGCCHAQSSFVSFQLLKLLKPTSHARFQKRLAGPDAPSRSTSCQPASRTRVSEDPASPHNYLHSRYDRPRGEFTVLRVARPLRLTTSQPAVPGGT